MPALTAPWYTSLSINATAPRPPSWNYSAADHHWLIAQQPPLSNAEARHYDLHYAARWRCLRATDDLLLALEHQLTALDLWNTTYLFITSDHGYHFGELRLGGGKWNVYDTDVRVPMRVIGPGITPGSTLGMVGSHVDLAPTFLALAGLETPADMDGRSLAHALISSNSKSTADHVRLDANISDNVEVDVGGALPRGGAYIEYHGLGPVGAPNRRQDAWNNTYRALRVIDRRPHGLGNVLYAEFGDFLFKNILFREFYEMDTDPWQLHNRFDALTNEERAQWTTRVDNLFRCKGAGCRMARDGD